jgi:ABC-type antimicrobial peptide transport system permease subunit
LPFTLYLSFETIRKETEEKGWGSIWSDENCYFLLKEGETDASVKDGLSAFYTKYNEEENFNNQKYELQPLSDLHFDDRFGNYNYNTVGKPSLLAFAVIALFLLVTAGINFINLTTAEAIKRSKEVGIRKTLGSTRMQLVFQFLGESTFVTLAATLLALGVSQLALSFLNPFLNLQLSLSLTSNIWFLVFLAGVVFFVALFSGLYPAFVVSAFTPASALKNSLGNKKSSGFFLRKGLVVAQFFISQFLIISTLVLISQMDYFKNKDLGFRKDAIVTIPIPVAETTVNDTIQKSSMRTLANRIATLPAVENFSLCNTPPSSGAVSGPGFIVEGETDDKRKDTQIKNIDDKYLSIFNLTLIEGQNVEDLDTARSVLVNRKLTEVAGFANPKDMLGKRIRIGGRFLPVVGVVENFHTTALSSEIEPTVLLNRKRNYRTLALQVNIKSFAQALPEIQKMWEETYPKELFSYRFLDESIRQFYESEERGTVLLSVFTSLAIFIGCLGLFGLATFMINQKNKEIGVRKVLGASVEGIVFMFSKEYVKLIAIGFVLAAPASWFIMHKWLETFAYKIEIGPSLFLAGFATTLLIAFLTVSYRSFKAARANPVKSLRYE